MDAGKIHLDKSKETWLATLYGKALDAGAERPILGDRLAAEAVARIDADFGALALPNGGDITLPMRALHFDRWTRDFLARHPSSTVLHLGCGLDTRVFRIDPGPEVRWIDVDLPEVIELRERLLKAVAAVLVLTPLVVSPRLAPLEDRRLAAEIERLAEREGVGDVRVEVENASRRTTVPNAEAIGVGPTTRVVLWDTLLDGRFSDREIRSIAAHELAHVGRDHLWKGIAWFALFALPAALGLTVG